VRKITELPVLTKICCVPLTQILLNLVKIPRYSDKPNIPRYANVTVRLILLD